jgi:hypothetical protein
VYDMIVVMEGKRVESAKGWRARVPITRW